MNKFMLFAFLALSSAGSQAAIHCRILTAPGDHRNFNQVIYEGEVEGRMIFVKANFEVLDLSPAQLAAKSMDNSLGELKDSTVIAAGYSQDRDMIMVSTKSISDPNAIFQPPSAFDSDMAMTEKSSTLVLTWGQRNLAYVCKHHD